MSSEVIDNNNSESQVKESLRLIEDLKFFLATAPANWQENQVIRRYYLNHDEGFVSCVFWNNLYFITGTDIVRCIVYKFEHFGRKIIDRKKFEEGIFSDLRNLKCGTDSILEPPRSEFLEFLFKNSCLRTQKKQKVFFWFNVPHDKLMTDALERDLKKEKLLQPATTMAVKEPALSFQYDESCNLYTQLTKHMEQQKKIISEKVTSSSNSDNNNNLQSSPEYKIKEESEEQDYGYLNEEETPAKFKTGSDYEDDFPLDYVDPNATGATNQEDYITLEPYEDDENNYETFLDPSIFIPSSSQIQTSNPVAFNDEYLIEQTQPLISSSATSIQPRSSKYYSRPGDEFFPFPTSTTSSYYPPQQQPQQVMVPPPLSAKFQIPTPTFLKPQPMPISATAQYYDPNQLLFHNADPYENEYWTNMAPMTSTSGYPMYEPFPTHYQIEPEIIPVQIVNYGEGPVSNRPGTAKIIKKTKSKQNYHKSKDKETQYRTLNEVVNSKTTRIVK
ncbi:Transcription factor CPH1 [Spathaspora sp. JA1]|nr:Transcription factor CPH1 [Spathaspora sp. JA1]